MPVLGLVNGYYLEIAIQIGIYVALALGLNIVVGFVGLLNLGFVAFYAIGAYLWAVFGSPQANAFIPGGIFPLSPNWFFVFLGLSIVVGALTGVILGLPVLRLRGDYLAVVTLGFAEVVRALVNNLDKPVNLTNGPRGISPDQQAAAILPSRCSSFSAWMSPMVDFIRCIFIFSCCCWSASLLSLPAGWKIRVSDGPGKRFAKMSLPQRPWAFRWCG